MYHVGSDRMTPKFCAVGDCGSRDMVVWISVLVLKLILTSQ